MQHPPTVYDVAARAGVSIATVSRVLRQPDVVRPETRRRVLATIDALGYVPSASGAALPAGGPECSVCWCRATTSRRRRGPSACLPTVTSRSVRDAERPERRTGHNLYFDDVLLGAEGAAWSAGYAFMVAVGAASRPLDLLDLAGRLDGLIVAAHPHESDLIARLRHRLPIALIAEGEVSRADRVTASNREGMFALVQHLAETHRVRTLVFVSGPPDSPDAAERRAGLLAASAAGGIVARGGRG